MVHCNTANKPLKACVRTAKHLLICSFVLHPRAAEFGLVGFFTLGVIEFALGEIEGTEFGLDLANRGF